MARRKGTKRKHDAIQSKFNENDVVSVLGMKETRSSKPVVDRTKQDQPSQTEEADELPSGSSSEGEVDEEERSDGSASFESAEEASEAETDSDSDSDSASDDTGSRSDSSSSQASESEGEDDRSNSKARRIDRASGMRQCSTQSTPPNRSNKPTTASVEALDNNDGPMKLRQRKRSSVNFDNQATVNDNQTTNHNTRQNTRGSRNAAPPKRQSDPKPSQEPESTSGSPTKYNLRQRNKSVNYAIPQLPKSPSPKYKLFRQQMRELEHQAEDMAALSDLEEAITPIRPNADGADDEARLPKPDSKMTGNDELEPILPMNLMELGPERCRRAGYSNDAIFGLMAQATGPSGERHPQPRASFDDIGGLDDYIRSLKEMVVLPLIYPEIYGSFGIKPPRGVLFHGPPGTGKTLMARALSQSCSSQKTGQPIAFFMRRGADCLSKWVGEAERQLRLLFEQAKAFQPSIVFFDELDGLAPVRSSRQDQIHSSIVATLLALMDGIDDRGQVVVIGATNRPDSIDPALRRPGRFDREMLFRLPGPDARRRILRIHTRNWTRRLTMEEEAEIVERTQGWGGADIGALCTESVLAAVRRCVPQIYESSEKIAIDPQQIAVCSLDIARAMSSITPSTKRSSRSGAAALQRQLVPLLGKYQRRATERLCAMLGIANNGGVRGTPDRMGLLTDTAVFKPRVAVYGTTGMGVHGVGAAVAHAVESLEVPVFELSATAMFRASDESASAHIARLFAEAQRKQPSVICISMVNRLAETIGSAAVAVLSSCMQEIGTSDRIGILVTAESTIAAAMGNNGLGVGFTANGFRFVSSGGPGLGGGGFGMGDRVDSKDVSVSYAERVWRAAVPPFARQWFTSTQASSRVLIGMPINSQREAFFTPVVEMIDSMLAASHPDMQLAEETTFGNALGQQPLTPEPSPMASNQVDQRQSPCAAEAAQDSACVQPQPSEAQTAHQREADKLTLRRLKHGLAEVTSILTKNRLFKPFVRPVNAENNAAYYSVVSKPMFLSTVALKTNARKYTTAQAYMEDIKLLCRNARSFSRWSSAARAAGDKDSVAQDEPSGALSGIDEDSGDLAAAERLKRIGFLEELAEKLLQKHLAPELVRAAEEIAQRRELEGTAAIKRRLSISAPNPAANGPHAAGADEAVNIDGNSVAAPQQQPVYRTPEPHTNRATMMATSAQQRRASSVRWSVSTFNNLSTRRRTTSSSSFRPSSSPRPATSKPHTPAEKTGNLGIPLVVHTSTHRKNTNAAEIRRTQFLSSLLDGTRGYSVEALEALRTRLVACVAVVCEQRGGDVEPMVYEALARVLKVWQDDAARDRLSGGAGGHGDGSDYYESGDGE